MVDLRARLGFLNPRRLRWERFLRDLPLDPDRLPRPLPAPTPRDFIICGCPRTGTTLVAAVLFQPPALVTVMEPWDGMRLSPAALFASLRRELFETGQVRRGRLDLPTLLAVGDVRWCQEGRGTVPVEVDPDYLLGVKWPAYWRYLDLLPDSKFLVCLRDPQEVILSLRDAGGRLAQGLNYDTRFNRPMNLALQQATGDAGLRRVLLFEYVHERVLPHLHRPNVFAVRYERWFHDRARLMEELSTFLGRPLGPGRPAIRQPREHEAPTSRERILLQRDCRTAEPLGYSWSAERPDLSGKVR